MELVDLTRDGKRPGGFTLNHWDISVICLSCIKTHFYCTSSFIIVVTKNKYKTLPYTKAPAVTGWPPLVRKPGGDNKNSISAIMYLHVAAATKKKFFFVVL